MGDDEKGSPDGCNVTKIDNGWMVTHVVMTPVGPSQRVSAFREWAEVEVFLRQLFQIRALN